MARMTFSTSEFWFHVKPEWFHEIFWTLLLIVILWNIHENHEWFELKNLISRKISNFRNKLLHSSMRKQEILSHTFLPSLDRNAVALMASLFPFFRDFNPRRIFHDSPQSHLKFFSWNHHAIQSLPINCLLPD